MDKKTMDWYIENEGTVCPFCKEGDLAGDEIDIQGNVAVQSVRCQNCDATWCDIYARVDITEVVKKTPADGFDFVMETDSYPHICELCLDEIQGGFLILRKNGKFYRSCKKCWSNIHEETENAQ